MAATVALGLFSGACALGAAGAYLKERRARQWPVTMAHIVEAPPQSLFERSGPMYILNCDSDHFLKWSVNG